mmetsp:Transcript_56021/g.119121  ORF Transcript_56021/g.119121 Transcript_56021/m.119121 type:complete len:391 (-) Transcript_56021:443-1615(-)
MAHRRRVSILASLLTVTVASFLLFVFATKLSLQNDADDEENLDRRRRLWIGKNLAQFLDPKSVTPRSAPAAASHRHGDPLLPRRNCQVIYVLGVEGSIHHGFMPVIRTLAEQQTDPETGTRYRVVKGHDALRSAIFGSKDKEREPDVPMDDPDLVRSTVDEMCPPPLDTWTKHVIIEGNSFPSGGADNTGLQFRVRRQWEWIDMSPEEISSSESALNHPTNLYKFYDAFSPHVDVRFVVLHRPYAETIASHLGFDRGPENHSNVISGYLLLLNRFLMGHMYAAPPALAAADTPLWTIVCADRLSQKGYDDEGGLIAARECVVGRLVEFLGWPLRSCPRCFDSWKESKKGSLEERMDEGTMDVLSDRVKDLEGIWPPRRREDDLLEQDCKM